MSEDRPGRLADRIGRLSTGVKMLLIISLGLLPLGLITILASIDSARANGARRAEQTNQRLERNARQLHNLVVRTAGAIDMANAAIALAPAGSGVCRSALERLVRNQIVPGRYALYANGRPRCATADYLPVPLAGPRHERLLVAISPDSSALRFAAYDAAGQVEGTGEFSRASLAALTTVGGTRVDFDQDLVQHGRAIALHSKLRSGPLDRVLTAAMPVARGLELRMRVNAVPISAVDVLLILLPVLMWIAAAIIGWLIIDRLLLLPLASLQQVVSGYRPDSGPLDIRAVRTPAREIGALGLAFSDTTRMLARHEADLEAALDRQTKLVREVHHRVKNNLQVVASLLNLHARGAASDEVAAAYASIQRRVDALAVVHRNHYAGLEDSRGVALRPIIAELTANLRATAPATAAEMAIRIDIDPVQVTQDVAVSVAFLITEIIEFGMLCDAEAATVSLDAAKPGSALLAVDSDSLRDNVDCDPDLFERFDRIVTGLSRQLRTTLERDPDKGRYALEIGTVGSNEA